MGMTTRCPNLGGALRASVAAACLFTATASAQTSGGAAPTTQPDHS
jgi:hypothetical protein